MKRLSRGRLALSPGKADNSNKVEIPTQVLAYQVYCCGAHCCSAVCCRYGLVGTYCCTAVVLLLWVGRWLGGEWWVVGARWVTDRSLRCCTAVVGWSVGGGWVVALLFRFEVHTAIIRFSPLYRPVLAYFGSTTRTQEQLTRRYIYIYRTAAVSYSARCICSRVTPEESNKKKNYEHDENPNKLDLREQQQKKRTIHALLMLIAFHLLYLDEL